MPLDPEQESSLHDVLRVARKMWVALSFIVPIVYLLIYSMQVLHGNPYRFLAGFGETPWGDPFVLSILVISILTVVSAIIFPARMVSNGKFKNAPVDAQLRVRLILTCALLESIAVYGLVLGFRLGPQLASLSLLLMLVPVVGGLFTFPSEVEWRTKMEQGQSPI